MSDNMVRQTLDRVAAFSRERGISLHLVGGFLRAQLMGEAALPTNVDLAIPAKALETSRALADELGGSYVCLDETTETARVIVEAEGGRVELDLSAFRGPTLERDLALRDFTINAIAVPLEIWCDGEPWVRRLIDPLGGRGDLEARLLRPCYPGTFEDDAVRILRAFRFASALGLTLDPQITPLLASAAPRLSGVAGERVRDELFGILQTDRASWALAELNRAGAVDVLFPELAAGRGLAQGVYHHLDVLAHQLETVAQCDRMLRDLEELSAPLRDPVAEYCRGCLVEQRSRKALIKLAGLFHDVGKPATRRVEPDGDIWFIGHEQFGAGLVEAVTERLRLSRREAEMVHGLVLYHLRPGHLSRASPLTPRAIFRFFRDLGEDGPACLLLWWADRLATRGPASRVDQIDQQRARLEELLSAYFFTAEEVVRPPRLINGTELMAALGLAPGPLIGKLLHAVEEAQADGQMRSRDDAVALARSLLAHP
jgi:putative nucleotidyltransferase with HDIG domain